MLEYLRNAADKPVAKILIGILAFSFIGWGVAEWIFGGSSGDTTLVRVGDTEITIQQFNLERTAQLSAISRDQQREIYSDKTLANALNQTVLSKLTTQAMTETHARDLGFVVSDAEVAREIREFPEFQDNGQFSPFLFDAVLMNTGYSEAAFANVLRNQIMREYTLGALSVPITIPEFAVDATYNARYAEREIDYTTVKFSDFSAGNPTDDELRAFYEQNPHTIPEQRTVSYVLIPADMDKPDSYDAAYERAIAVEDDIIAGDTMDSAAARHDAKYVALGTFDADNRPVDKLLTDRMMTRIFDMESGLESEIIETDDGFVIVRVDNIIPSHNAEFESVRKNLVSDWKRNEQRKQAYVHANELLVDLNQTGNLANARNKTVSRASGAPLDVLTATFNSEIGSNSIVSGDDEFYVLHIEQEILPQHNEKRAKDLRTELQNMINRQVVDDYNEYLIRKYPVEINERVFNRFFAN